MAGRRVSKTARRSSRGGWGTKDQFQAAPDVRRVISLGSGKFAYVFTEVAKTRHFATDDPAFLVELVRVERVLPGYIRGSLARLATTGHSWPTILEDFDAALATASSDDEPDAA